MYSAEREACPNFTNYIFTFSYFRLFGILKYYFNEIRNTAGWENEGNKRACIEDGASTIYSVRERNDLFTRGSNIFSNIHSTSGTKHCRFTSAS